MGALWDAVRHSGHANVTLRSNTHNHKLLVARSDASQRNVICDLTPFITKKYLTDFLAEVPTWINDLISQVFIKPLCFDTDPETRLRELHARIGNLNKTVRKEKQKLRR